MEHLHGLLGRESELAAVCRELKFELSHLGAPVTGALLVTCADETEHECAETFQRVFARELLPRLKYGSHVPFRIANPGARYEWGSLGIAEDHFAAPETSEAFKVLLVKINSHVAVDRSGEGLRFGIFQRYGLPSTCCGAMDALLRGASLPFLHDLEEAFRSENRDRLAALQEVEPGLRPLFASLVNARLQARRAVLDIQDHRPRTPTYYVVLWGVTLNRPGPDAEILGGLYTLDRRGRRPRDHYRGLGDDPGRYELLDDAGKLRVVDDQIGTSREARDHRQLARARVLELETTSVRLSDDWKRIAGDVRKGHHRRHTRQLLEAGLHLLGAIAPLPTALILLGRGTGGIWHAHRLQQAATRETQDRLARDVIEQVRGQIDRLPPDQAEEILESLVAEYG